MVRKFFNQDTEIKTQEYGIVCFNTCQSTAPEGILNEQIKATFMLMKDINLKLFNVIFYT